MTVIEEKKIGREITYNIYNNVDEKKPIRIIRFPMANQELNDYNYLMIYNDEIEPIHGAFDFLNMNEAYQSLNTRLKNQ